MQETLLGWSVAGRITAAVSSQSVHYNLTFCGIKGAPGKNLDERNASSNSAKPAEGMTQAVHRKMLLGKQSQSSWDSVNMTYSRLFDLENKLDLNIDINS